MRGEGRSSAVSVRPSLFAVSAIEQLAHLLHVARQELEEFTSPSAIRYTTEFRRKRSGGRRRLDVPGERLGLLQEKIKDHVLSKLPALPCTHGGILDRSARTNAALHTGKPVVVCLDLQDFFPSVSTAMAHTIFQTLGFRGEALDFLVSVTTFRGALPQGTHTSPALANLAAVRLDFRFMGLAEAHRSRFVDDLTFSGGAHVPNLLPLIGRIIAQEGFRENVAKRRIMWSWQQQVVTGIVVNKKVNVTKTWRRRLRKAVLSELNGGGLSESTAGKLAWGQYLNPTLGVHWRPLDR